MGQGYRISAKANEADVLIYEDVGDSWFGGVSAKQFADDLKALGKVDTINLRLNSAGGDVFDGLAIYRQLVDHPARVITHIDGIAASIASVIAMAGTEIRIAEAGFLMIHDAWGMQMGNADDMRRMADLLHTTTGSIADVYKARTPNTPAQIKAWMAAETWFTAAEAIDNGFASVIAPNMRVAARVEGKHKFRCVPAALASGPEAVLPLKRLPDGSLERPVYDYNALRLASMRAVTEQRKITQLRTA